MSGFALSSVPAFLPVSFFLLACLPACLPDFRSPLAHFCLLACYCLSPWLCLHGYFDWFLPAYLPHYLLLHSPPPHPDYFCLLRSLPSFISLNCFACWPAFLYVDTLACLTNYVDLTPFLACPILSACFCLPCFHFLCFACLTNC
jgi:hypothetical protein